MKTITAQIMDDGSIQLVDGQKFPFRLEWFSDEFRYLLELSPIKVDIVSYESESEVDFKVLVRKG